jgi:endonuclease III
MSDASHSQVVDVLLDRYGRTFASEAGIRLDRNTPAPLFRLLVMSLLVSARISSEIAIAATRALADAGWTTPASMLDSTWEERTRVLNRAGYARYDESTARYLEQTTTLLTDRYDGDLRNLREEAGRDPDREHRLLTDFTGIGDVGAHVFLREVQVLWDELDPYVDERTLERAAELTLPSTAADLRRTVPDVGTFARLVAAIVRAGLQADTDELLAEASGR